MKQTPKGMSPRRKTPSLLRNTAAQSGPMLLGYFLSFVSAPVVVAGLGFRQFGIWAVTGALAQYAALLDLGAGAALSRFIAAHESDRRTCGEYIAIGSGSVTLVGMVMMGAAAAAAGPLSRSLHGISVADMRVVLMSSAIVLFSSMLNAVVAAYPVGLRRMMAPNVGIAIGFVISFFASVVSVVLGADLPIYAMANAGAGVLSTLVVTTLVLRSEGSIPIAWPSLGRLRGFVGYGLKNQLVRWTELINYQTDKIVIALSIGPSAAGAYELANRVAVAARQVGVYPLSALLPTLTAEISRHGIDQVRKRYGRLLEVTVAVAFPPLLLTAALAPLLLSAWLPHVPANTTLILAALSVAYIASASSGVGYVVAAAASDPGIAARVATGTAILNIALTVALAPSFGIWGVLSGTVIALTAGALAQVALIHRRFSLSQRAYRDAVVPALNVCVLLATPIAVFSYTQTLENRVVQACAVIGISGAYTALYARWAIRAGRVRKGSRGDGPTDRSPPSRRPVPRRGSPRNQSLRRTTSGATTRMTQRRRPGTFRRHASRRGRRLARSRTAALARRRRLRITTHQRTAVAIETLELADEMVGTSGRLDPAADSRFRQTQHHRQSGSLRRHAGVAPSGAERSRLRRGCLRRGAATRSAPPTSRLLVQWRDTVVATKPHARSAGSRSPANALTAARPTIGGVEPVSGLAAEFGESQQPASPRR